MAFIRKEHLQPELYARILIASLGVAVALALLPFISGLVGAAILAIVLGPLYRRLAAGIGPRTAALVTTLGAALLMLLPAAVLVLSVLGQAPSVARAVSQSTLLQRLSTLQIAGVNVGSYTDEAVNAVFSWVSGQAVTLVGGLTMATLNIVIALFGVYYLLAGNGAEWHGARRWLPFSRQTVDLLATQFRTTTESMIIGVVLTAVSQGLVVGIAFALTGLPSAGFWGFMTACVSILPVLGSSLIWLPGALVLAADGRYAAAITLGIIGVVVASQIDNVIRLFVYRRVSQIHPMVTLVGAFAGLRIFGFAGLLLGPLAISYLLELLKAYSAEYGGRGLPSPVASAGD